MKLQHMPIGARFEYQGIEYVKTGPLTASSVEGGQRIIPRSATLRPLDGQTADQAGNRLDVATVMAAVEDFHGACLALVDEGAKPALEAARQKMMARLK